MNTGHGTNLELDRNVDKVRKTAGQFLKSLSIFRATMKTSQQYSITKNGQPISG